MRPVVIDTSWLLPAFLSRGPRPWSRGLLILTALGGLTLRRHTIQAELQALNDEGERYGAASNYEHYRGRLTAIEHRRDELRDRLGLRAPDDLCLVGSRLLFDEVERKVRDVGRKLDPRLSDDAPAHIRRQVQRLTAILVDFDPHERLRAWTRDPADDYVIETAFRA